MSVQLNVGSTVKGIDVDSSAFHDEQVIGSNVEGFYVDSSAFHDDQVKMRQVCSASGIPRKGVGRGGSLMSSERGARAVRAVTMLNYLGEFDESDDAASSHATVVGEEMGNSTKTTAL